MNIDIKFSRRIEIVGLTESELDEETKDRISKLMYERLRKGFDQATTDLLTNTITLRKDDYKTLPEKEENPGVVKITGP